MPLGTSNPVGTLNERAQRGEISETAYTLEQTGGPAHAPVFSCTATTACARTRRAVLAEAFGTTKADAHSAAAALLLERLAAPEKSAGFPTGPPPAGPRTESPAPATPVTTSFAPAGTEPQPPVAAPAATPSIVAVPAVPTGAAAAEEQPSGAKRVNALWEALRSGCAVVCTIGTVPADTRLVLCRDDGKPMPDAAPDGTTLLDLDPGPGHESDPRLASVRGWAVPTATMIPLLLTPDDDRRHPTTRAWARLTRLALRAIAERRVRPALTATGRGTWRIGPLDPPLRALLDAAGAALPQHAHRVATGGSPPHIDTAAQVVTAWLDAIADTHLHTPGAEHLVGRLPFAVPGLAPDDATAEWIDTLENGFDDHAPLPRLALHVTAPADDRPDTDTLPLTLHVHPTSPSHSANDATPVPHARLHPADRERARRALRRAARIWPPLRSLADRADPHTLAVTGPQALDLLGAAGTALTAADVTIHWPEHLLDALTASTVVGTRSPTGVSGRRLALENLLDFRWQLALDDVALTDAEMDRLAEAARPLVRLRDRWILVDPVHAARARERNLGTLAPPDALAAALSGTATVDGVPRPCTAADGFATLIGALRTASSTVPGRTTARPPGLAAPLRGYQQRGLEWLIRTTDLGFGALLADDMGLGKTITAIAFHLHRRTLPRPGPTLVVCTASLVTNWAREIARFAPHIPVRRYHGTDRDLHDLDPHTVVITTYGVLQRDRTHLATVDWDLIVADEAQHVKNHRTKAARALREVPSRTAIAITGTPMENNASDIWSILDWTNPGLFGDHARFRARHGRDAERDTSGAGARRLGRLVGPFMLRRLKSDPAIAPELPAKVRVERVVPLSREQTVLYEAVVRETMDLVREASGITRRALVLKLLQGLRQICNHPGLYLKESLDAWNPDTAADRSEKLRALEEILDTARTRDEAALVFTGYVGMGHMIRTHLQTCGLDALFLHGGTPTANRTRMVDALQNGDTRILLLSIKAAGTGLNLTRATHVVHYDHPWNPAVEDQATDRAHRIGQHHTVHVHHLLTENTIEDHITALLARKRALTHDVLTAGETALADLDDADLADLIGLGAHR
ncbi:DEAD/DEAH box helicase [Embleya sp. NBC_00896]|uniref:DEAD/DEAH box helicase n=1 Tax=Embleya sp. NBC_00896 TaxID=2975961 RepID=UPI002F90C2EF|nr:SNF2-related protein [Embleya sp. NBC_00896]